MCGVLCDTDNQLKSYKNTQFKIVGETSFEVRVTSAEKNCY